MSLRADTGTNKLAVQEHCYLWYPGSNDTRVPLTGKWMRSRWADRDGTPCLLTTLPQHFSFALAHLVPAHLPPPALSPCLQACPTGSRLLTSPTSRTTCPLVACAPTPRQPTSLCPPPFTTPPALMWRCACTECGCGWCEGGPDTACHGAPGMLHNSEARQHQCPTQLHPAPAPKHSHHGGQPAHSHTCLPYLRAGHPSHPRHQQPQAVHAV